MNRRIVMALEVRGNDERIAEHFAVCSKFLVCELDEHCAVAATEAYFNPLAGQYTGACQLPGYVNQFNVAAIIVGGMGNNAIAKFRELGIEVINAPGLTFDAALSVYAEGRRNGNVSTSGCAR